MRSVMRRSFNIYQWEALFLLVAGITGGCCCGCCCGGGGGDCGAAAAAAALLPCLLGGRHHGCLLPPLLLLLTMMMIDALLPCLPVLPPVCCAPVGRTRSCLFSSLCTPTPHPGICVPTALAPAVNQLNYCGKGAGGDMFTAAAVLYTLGARMCTAREGPCAEVGCVASCLPQCAHPLPTPAALLPALPACRCAVLCHRAARSALPYQNFQSNHNATFLLHCIAI